jgi:outer membrane protein assembly factor BamD (BamD/ComL family)
MKRIILILVAIAALTLAGCSGENVKEVFETAQLEELQNNYDHAKELYRNIIEKHPESAYAPKAREKLDALRQAGH